MSVPLPWALLFILDVFKLPSVDIFDSLRWKSYTKILFPIAFTDKMQYKNSRQDPTKARQSSSSFQQTSSSTNSPQTSIMKLVSLFWPPSIRFIEILYVLQTRKTIRIVSLCCCCSWLLLLSSLRLPPTSCKILGRLLLSLAIPKPMPKLSPSPFWDRPTISKRTEAGSTGNCF